MGIFSRMVNLCKADLHGVMDQIEDKGLLLRQHLRDMSCAIGDDEAKLKAFNERRRNTLSSRRMLSDEIQKIDSDLTMAIEKQKDDIARLLIRKIYPMKKHHDELSNIEQELHLQISQLADTIQVQRMEYEKYKLRAADWMQETRRIDTGDNAPGGNQTRWIADELSAEEVELELLQRKDKVLGGNTNE
ncbi:MAG: hypothetical protein HKM93_04835 [Desulfobacteraceae bacterium]|nr:hypothetical protein [Desulfobacteraceae bacterium]